MRSTFFITKPYWFFFLLFVLAPMVAFSNDDALIFHSPYVFKIKILESSLSSSLCREAFSVTEVLKGENSWLGKILKTNEHCMRQKGEEYIYAILHIDSDLNAIFINPSQESFLYRISKIDEIKKTIETQKRAKMSLRGMLSYFGSLGHFDEDLLFRSKVFLKVRVLSHKTPKVSFSYVADLGNYTKNQSRVEVLDVYRGKSSLKGSVLTINYYNHLEAPTRFFKKDNILLVNLLDEPIENGEVTMHYNPTRRGKLMGMPWVVRLDPDEFGKKISEVSSFAKAFFIMSRPSYSPPCKTENRNCEEVFLNFDKCKYKTDPKCDPPSPSGF